MYVSFLDADDGIIMDRVCLEILLNHSKHLFWIDIFQKFSITLKRVHLVNHCNMEDL